MSDTDTDTERQPADPTGEPTDRRLNAVIAGVVIVTLLIGIAICGVMVWAITRDKPARVDLTEGHWESVMRKAGVEADYPGGPVPLESIATTGSHPFSADITGSEVEALVGTYPYSGSLMGADLELERADITFPEAGRIEVSVSVEVDGTSYSGRISIPVRYEDGQLVQADGEATVRAMGIKLSGQQADDAIDQALSYVNRYLDAAPGLTIETAEVVRGSVRVTGTAPDALDHPSVP